MTSRHEDERRKTNQAKRDLERVHWQSDRIGTSNLGRLLESTKDRFSGSDADQNDPIEVLGTRIGRGLGLIAFIGLAIYLFFTYVIN